jgi:dTDP-4-dehydrorhamnose 3,5-epimerase-like enzyme
MVIEPDVFSDDRGFFLDSSTFRTALARICIESDFAEVQ